MVEHQSKEVVDKISDELKIQPALKIPRELGKDLQLVYNVNPIHANRLLGSLARTTTATSPGSNIAVLSTSKQSHITGIHLQNQSDVTADNTSIEIRAVLLGATRNIIQFLKITTTVFDKSTYITFDPPLKPDIGTNIVFVNAFTAGVSVSAIQVYGYDTDVQ